MRLAILLVASLLGGAVLVPTAEATEASAPTPEPTPPEPADTAESDTGPDPGSSCRPYCFAG